MNAMLDVSEVRATKLHGLHKRRLLTIFSDTNGAFKLQKKHYPTSMITALESNTKRNKKLKFHSSFSAFFRENNVVVPEKKPFKLPFASQSNFKYLLNSRFDSKSPERVD